MKHLTLIAIAVSVAGCTGDGSNKGTCAPTNALETVVDRLTLPSSIADGAFDIDGDGNVDNAMAAVIGALSGAGLDSQGAVDDAIVSGNAPILIEVDSTDAALANDTCVEVTFGIGLSLPSIKLDGTDHVSIDTSVATVTIGGELVGNVFTSNAPNGKPRPVPMLIGFANSALNVPISAAHVTFAVDAIAGKLGPAKLGGAILQSDIDNVFLPGIAAQLTSQITTSLAHQFDTGGIASPGCNTTCKEPSTGVCAIAGDNIIVGCEIAGSAALHTLLLPDVSILNASGDIAPDHGRTPKDALSLGLTFEAVTAAY